MDELAIADWMHLREGAVGELGESGYLVLRIYMSSLMSEVRYQMGHSQ